MIQTKSFLLQAALALSYGIAFTHAFTTTGTTIKSRQTATELFYNRNNDDDSHEVFDLDILEQRIGNLRLKIMEDDLLRPPSAKLSPEDFVQSLLEGLFYNEDPRPDAGFMLLLQCSTDNWANSVLQSVGAPKNANLDTVASALGAAIARPHNQYAILVGEEESSVDENGERNFYFHFPGEPLDFLDGTAWVNVEFRDKADDSLLVLIGWQLVQRPDGAWLVDQIDWQDYRDAYRPGIGREDWMPFEGRRR